MVQPSQMRPSSKLPNANNLKQRSMHTMYSFTLDDLCEFWRRRTGVEELAQFDKYLAYPP